MRYTTKQNNLATHAALLAFRRCVSWLLLVAGVLVSNAAGQSELAGEFEHLPLLYRGPDPTANYLLPVSLGDDDEPTDLLWGPAEVVDEHGELIEGELIEGEPVDGSLDLTFPDVIDSEQLLDPPISDHRNGFYQKIKFSTGYIDRPHLDDFGITEFDLAATFAVPLPSRDWPLLMGPVFNMRLIDGPLTPDLPPRLYEARFDFLWVPRLSERWTAVVGVSPGFYSDFEADNSDAWRLTGMGLLRYDFIPDQLQLVGGVLYLNRQDVELLPAGGIIWKPTPDKHYQLVFPRPELACRIRSGSGWEDWLYVGGEFGGNSYAFDNGGINDQVTLRDFRALLGLRRKQDGGTGYHLEVGYVMGRQAEFESGIPDAEADDTAIIRGGVTF